MHCPSLFVWCAFTAGIFLGSFLAIILTYDKQLGILAKPKRSSPYMKWVQKQGLSTLKLSLDELRYGNKSYNTEANFLYREVTILCIVLVSNKKNAIAARATWGQSCNDIKFVELVKQKKPVVKRKDESNWVILCTLLRSLKHNHKWFMFVYDTSFVIVENLRFLLAHRDHKKGIYLGHPVTFWTKAFNSGKAGYVISQGSLQLLQNKLQLESCDGNNAFMNLEDFYLGKYLYDLSIFPEDTRDSYNLSRFHIYNWQQEFFPGLNYYKTSVYPAKCCSKNAITFQTIEGDKMYTYYYLLHKLQIFTDGSLGNVAPSSNLSKDYVWKSFLQEQGSTREEISPEEYYKLWENLVRDPNSFGQQFRPDNGDNF